MKADSKSRRARPAAPAPAREERRRRIVQAATRSFASQGYAACDMDSVATRLRIAKGTIYLYFNSKEELFRACVDAQMTSLQERIQQAVEQEPEPFQQIAAAIRAYLGFFHDHPDAVELLIQERAAFQKHRRSVYFEHRDAARIKWREFYQRLKREGRLRADLEVDALLDTIGSLVFGAMYLNHLGGRSLSPDEQYRSMLDIVLRGALSDAERAKLSKSIPPVSR